MKKSASISEEKADRLENNKKLTKYVSENITKCESILSSARSTTKLFSVQAIAIRSKLRDSIERVIMSGSATNKQRIEELLWRKVYYEPLSMAKKFRQGHEWSEVDSGLIWTHLNDGIAYYHQLLISFSFVFKVSDFTANLLPFFHQDEEQNYKNVDGSLKDSFFRSLTCLGDLTRYKLEFQNTAVDDKAYLQSVRYYYQALHYNADGGLTHSNLGTVYSSNSQPLLAGVHYLRAITCDKPFESAENNLKKMLDRSRIWLENKKLEVENSEGAETRLGKDSKHFLHTCLALVSFFISTSKKPEEIAVLCQDVLVQLGKLLDEYDNNDPTDLSESSPANGTLIMELKSTDLAIGKSYASKRAAHSALSKVNTSTFVVNPESMVTLCSLFILCVKRLVVQNSSNSNMSELLLVSILATLVSHISKRLEQRFSLIDPSFVVNLLPAVKEDVIEKQPETEEIDNKLVNGEEKETEVNNKKKKSKLSKLRRRMKDDEEDDNDRESDQGEISSDEEDDLSDVSSVLSGNFLCSSEDESDEDVKIEFDGEEWQGISADEHVSLIEQEGMLAAVNVTLFWLVCNQDLIKQFSKDGYHLWDSIAKLANLLHIDFKQLKTDGTLFESEVVESLQKVWSSPSDLVDVKTNMRYNSVPLPENLMLHVIFPKFQVSGIARNLKNSEQNILRLFRLNILIHDLANREDTPLFLENNKFIVDKTKMTETIQNDKLMNGKLSTNGTNDENKLVNNVNEDGNSIGKKNKGELGSGRTTASMEALTKRWLQYEVRNLEEEMTTPRRNRNKMLGGLYVVPDVFVLIHHLPTLKKMLAAPSHMIIIPQIVLDALDESKRDSVGAREAIRWLETKLKCGSRFIRLQRSHEKSRLPLIKYPKRKDKIAWEWFNLAECCFYLGAQLKNDTNPKISTVTLLTGESPNNKKKLSFSRSTLAEAAGAALMSVEDFTRKWQISSVGHS